MKRMINSFALRQTIGVLEGNAVSTAVLARWTIFDHWYPALADLIAEHPEWLKHIAEKVKPPLKPLRAGMPGDPGLLVVTRVILTTTKRTRGLGCSGHPAFPTPSRGERSMPDSCALRCESVNAYLDLERRHCEERLVRRS